MKYPLLNLVKNSFDFQTQNDITDTLRQRFIQVSYYEAHSVIEFHDFLVFRIDFQFVCLIF